MVGDDNSKNVVSVEALKEFERALLLEYDYYCGMFSECDDSIQKAKELGLGGIICRTRLNEMRKMKNHCEAWLRLYEQATGRNIIDES